MVGPLREGRRGVVARERVRGALFAFLVVADERGGPRQCEHQLRERRARGSLPPCPLRRQPRPTGGMAPRGHSRGVVGRLRPSGAWPHPRVTRAVGVGRTRAAESGSLRPQRPLLHAAQSRHRPVAYRIRRHRSFTDATLPRTGPRMGPSPTRRDLPLRPCHRSRTPRRVRVARAASARARDAGREGSRRAAARSLR